MIKNVIPVVCFFLGVLMLTEIIWQIQRYYVKKNEKIVSDLIKQRKAQISTYLDREEFCRKFKELQTTYGQIGIIINRLKHKYYFLLNRKSEREKRKNNNLSSEKRKKSSHKKVLIESDDYIYNEHPDDLRVKKYLINGITSVYLKVILIYPTIKVLITAWENIKNPQEILKATFIVGLVLLGLLSVIAFFLGDISVGTVFFCGALSLIGAAMIFVGVLTVSFIKYIIGSIFDFSISENLITQVLIMLLWVEIVLIVKNIHCILVSRNVIKDAYISRDQLNYKIKNHKDEPYIDNKENDNYMVSIVIDSIEENLKDIESTAVKYCLKKGRSEKDKIKICNTYNDYFIIGELLNQQVFEENNIDYYVLQAMYKMLIENCNKSV